MRIFIDIGAFRPAKHRIESVRVQRDRQAFEADIPPRANLVEIRHYALKQASERFLEFFVPSLAAIIILCLVYDWGLLFGSLAAVIVLAVPIALWIYRRVLSSLEPLRAGWSIASDAHETRVFRRDEQGQELAAHISFRDLHGMKSQRIEDDVLFDYVHDQFSNELELRSSSGGVCFAEGLDYDTCEEVVTEFGRYVERLRNDRAAASMPGVPGLDD
ncbi:MAG: hypothetical protein ACQEVA_19720 [Myxococcota bacterium]